MNLIFDTILAGIKGVGDSLVGVIKEFHLSPEVEVRLTQAVRQQEMDFARDMLSLELHDRDSARKREVETKDPTTRQLAFFYTGGYFSVLGLAWGFGIPPGMHDTIVTLLGVLTAAQMAVVGYYFGSSHGSTAKDTTIQQAMVASSAKDDTISDAMSSARPKSDITRTETHTDHQVKL